jgi:hypothetical protein
MQHPAIVGAGRVVVGGKQIAGVVEGQFLRIAQAEAEQFEIPAVGFASQHTAAVGDFDDDAFAIGDVEAAVAEAHVDPAVGPEGEPVEVMAGDADVHAEARGENGPGRGGTGGEPPQVRDVGEPEMSVVGEDPGGGAVGDRVKACGENFGGIRAAGTA